MARQEHHADIALAHLPLQPGKPDDDGAVIRILVGEQLHLDLAVEAVLRLQGGCKIARVFRGPCKLVDSGVLELGHAHHQGGTAEDQPLPQPKSECQIRRGHTSDSRRADGRGGTQMMPEGRPQAEQAPVTGSRVSGRLRPPARHTRRSPQAQSVWGW